MSGCDVGLVAPRPAGLTADDWRWAARWLGEALGARVHVAETADALGDAPCVLDDGGEIATSALLARACGSLRHARTAEPSPVAELDRGIVELGQRIDAACPGVARVPLVPRPYRCALVLTHDVDNVDRWTAQHVRHLARHVPERLGFEGARAIVRLPWAAVRRLWDRPRIAERIEACIALERRFGARASFLFFSPATRHRTAHDGWYTPATRVGPRRLGDLWRELARDGFDIGLHLSIGAHADDVAVAAEWDALRAHAPDIASCRSHYLKEAPGRTVEALAAAGARVDLNLVTTGFAHGTGAPFPSTAPGLHRLPTVIEDQALTVDGADRALRERVWESWERVLAETRRNGSIATVLLHPGKADAPVLLERLLRWGADNEAWMTSAASLVRAWRERTVTADVDATAGSPAHERRDNVWSAR